MLLTEELKEALVESGTESQLRRLHEHMIGRVMTHVQVTANVIIIRVLPTSTCGAIPVGSKTIVWASINRRVVQEDSDGKIYGYRCVVHNLPGEDPIRQSLGLGTETYHQSLRSAVRHARKAVGLYAEKQSRGWSHAWKTTPLESLYPSEIDIQIRRDYEELFRMDIEEQFECMDAAWEEDFASGQEREWYV